MIDRCIVKHQVKVRQQGKLTAIRSEISRAQGSLSPGRQGSDMLHVFNRNCQLWRTGFWGQVIAGRRGRIGVWVGRRSGA
jgi:hypothetical protein